MEDETRRLQEENARLRAENASLREDALFLDSIVENIPNMIFVKGADELRFIRFNRAGERLLGYDRADLIGCNDYDFFPSEEADFFTAKDREVLAAGGIHEIPEEPIHTSHGLRWLHTMKIPILDATGQPRYLLGISADITEAKTARQALAAQSEKLSLLLTRFPGVVWTASAEQEITSTAGAHAEGLGTEIVRWRQPGATEVHVLDRIFEIWVEALEDGGTMGIALDVTERRRVEAEQLQEHLQQTERLQTLGLLAGGIAHDFNNLLASILGNADLALMMLPEDAPVRDLLEKIESITETAASLTRQMLAYSGQGRFVVEPINLSTAVREIGSLLEVSISKSAELLLNLNDDLPLIEADDAQIRQLVMNLITNASDALDGRSGRISLTTNIIDADRTDLSVDWLAEDLPMGRYVTLEVADTGKGMDVQTRLCMFDPFFTTKPTGHGLGMSAALGIVRGHKGAIRVNSEPGKGTVIKILLPVMDTTAPVWALPVPVPAPSATTRSGGFRVLAVDDDVSIRSLLERAFIALGFDAVLASSGEAALSIFAEDPGRFDVIVLDMTMPGLSGEETLKVLRELDPGARVLLTSGYSKGEEICSRAGKGSLGFIQKPFRLKALADAIQMLLGEANAPRG